ncbi:flagellin [Sphingomonas sp. ABOLD]|uniref:Flagellin n=1 Tax=Sphingomonas trueperi TaxID=53317 RepID=A0A7X5XYE0_9SPHN|nr:MULTISPECIES: flagellin [Sphingomonas]NJB97644.1 flagellin [Sphingomonas trueperi]RSV43541.1 flagellin [Sphingomonas sp. ABOLE]RSV52850.1 flagellin [Sphingomonas sp. ABOLD]
MAFSVNTNVGAMAALQSLNATNKDLATTQSRINTGLSVSSTKDDSASYTIAQGLRGDLGGLKAVSSSLSRAKSVTDVAVAGAEQISDIVNQMQAKARQAADSGIDTSTRDALNKDFTALRDQITTIVNASDFNGTNLLKASGGTVTALQSLQDSNTSTTAWNPDSLSVANQGLDLGGSTVTVASTGQINTQAAAQTMVDTLETTKSNLKTTLSTLGAASRKIDAQQTFTSKLSDVIDGGIGNLVDADLAKESARLQALQVKQQLGVQALSIANQAPQTITSLFR